MAAMGGHLHDLSTEGGMLSAFPFLYLSGNVNNVEHNMVPLDDR